MLATSYSKTWMRGSAMLAFLLVSSALSLGASTFTVSSTADSGPGSLRAALSSAANGDTINFSLAYPATITLATPLTLGPSVTITGPGSANLAISGGNSVGVLVVNAGATVQIAGVTITQGGSGLGGCIFNAGTLTLTNTTVTACVNYAELGGAILNAGNAATLNLNGSTITGNFAGTCLTTILGAGGGIFNYLGAVNLTNSTVSQNIADGGPGASGSCFEGGSIGWGGGGGGIFNFGGTLTVNSSTISYNVSSFGGGIYNAEGGTLALANSTIAGNIAGAAGGGIYTGSDSSASISFSTIWSNTANGLSGLTSVSLNPPSTGGSGPSCCIQIALPDTAGGGIDYGGMTLSIKNSILSANSTGANSSNCHTAFGDQFTSLGHNFSDDASCTTSFIQPNDVNNIPAALDPGGLKDNGGPTHTIALLSASPAINAIPSNACTDASGNPVATDQRGVPRPQGSGCDIGAFEYFPVYQVPAVQTFLLMGEVQSSTLQPIARDILKVILQVTVDSLNRGEVRAAKGQLKVFVLLVDGLVAAGKLDQQQANAWISSAEEITRNLGG